MCDMRVAARDAVLCVSDAPHGLAPTGGLTWLLPRLVGAGRARWMALSDVRMSAEEAHAYGLVDEVAGDAVERATVLAAQIAAYPGIGVEIARVAFDRAERGSLEEAIATEIELNLRAMEHPDVRAAFDAFLD
jgi:2-(1,2-epoxy-1,2-dihydrophenyl)acetyl-CoA isomerase